MSQLNKIRVLTADDEYWSRENLRNLLSWEDYEMEFLEPACDGEEVLERMAQEHPDILLTDINMPFMDGLELLSRVQKEYPDVIAVAVSGYDDFEKVKVKPFDLAKCLTLAAELITVVTSPFKKS